MPGVKIKTYPPKAESSRKKGLFESIIHHVFSPMKLGRLTMILPDGHCQEYGLGGGHVEATIRINNDNFFKRCVLFGDVGFGESYVEGDWDTDDITKVIKWMILNVENHPTLMSDRMKWSPVNFLKFLNKVYFALQANTIRGSRKNISEHYDLGNNFFKLFLDPSMTYSAACFRDEEEDLEAAQNLKYDELCRKLDLKPTDHVLEIGSGWGGFAIHAAKNYGSKITTITISKEQYEFAKERVKQEKLTGRIDIRLTDYRRVGGLFDKIVSIEMIEAVGHKFLPTFFTQCHRLLKKDGLLGLQMILSPDHRYDSFRKNVDWIQKHIFPGSILPSLSVIQRAIAKTGDLMLHDFEDMTPSYVKTLRLWRENFNQKINKVQELGFDDVFVRKWNYYKSYCEAAFNMRNISVAQAVFTRPNNLNLKKG